MALRHSLLSSVTRTPGFQKAIHGAVPAEVGPRGQAVVLRADLAGTVEALDVEVAAEGAAEAVVVADTFGLGFRPELAAGILEFQNEIDVIEIIADDLFRLRGKDLDHVRILANSFEITLHGVSLGMATSHNVYSGRIDLLARIIDRITPKGWSEHLAFVRADGYEIGHLAAPPRTDAVIEGTLENLKCASDRIGARPLLENIATLIDPPMNQYSETEWTSLILRESGCNLLLDLHNLYANALNFGLDPFEMLSQLPPERIQMIHLSGGRWIAQSIPEQKFTNAGSGVTHTEKRWLDDHLHDPPDIIYDLLEQVAATVKQPVAVLIERDGNYPGMDELVVQLRKARAAVQRGRLRQAEANPTPDARVKAHALQVIS